MGCDSFFKENQLNEALLQSGTWPAFIRLLDNYNYETGVKETESDENTSEEDTFLDAIVDTVVMDKLWEGLLNAGKCIMKFVDMMRSTIELFQPMPL